MKLETFFEKFDQFADAPDAVEKMRTLVLNLAVQGRLVPNSFENALGAEQIASEKQRRMRELNIRSHPETPQPTENDFPFSLPRTWHAVTLGDLAFSCPTSYGEDPSPSLPKAGVVKVGNIDNEGGFKGQFSVRGFLPEEIESLLARRGDLMVVKSSGSAENVHSGKTALCTADHDGKIVGTNFVLRLRLIGTAAFPEYVWRVLTSRYSRAWIEGTVQTMTYPNLKWSDFARLPIPLPPLDEQKRIVAKVDELMELCDRLESQQQERETRHAALARASLARFADAPSPANLNFLFHKSYTIPPVDLRKSILTLAVQGKLVPQNPIDEPAEEVIGRIVAMKLRLQKTGDIGKEKPVEPLQPDSLPFEAPESWRWAKLAELTELITKGSSPKWQGIAYVPESEGVLFITSENVGNYVLRKLDDLKYVAREFNEIEPRSILKRGDILMNLVGGSIGRTAVYDLHDGANINQAVAMIRLVRETDGVCPKFLLHYLNSPSAIDYMLSSRVVNAQPNISLTDAREFAVPIPPLPEQLRIVAKVDQLMALVDALETQLAASRATAANLLSALVAELTSQN